MELFPANFANVLFKLILKEKGTDQVQNSDLKIKRIYIGVLGDQVRALRTVAVELRKCTKRNLKLQSKSIKFLNSVETDLIHSEYRTGSVPFNFLLSFSQIRLSL